MSVFTTLKKNTPNWMISLALLGLVSCSESTSDNENEAALSNAAPLATAASIHANILVLDAHADIVIPSTSRSYISDDGTSKVSPDKMRSGGVDAVVMSIAVGPGPRTPAGDAAARAEADEKLAAILSLVEQSQGTVVLATTVAEIESAHERNQSAVILGFQNARSLEGNVSAINEFYQGGVRIFGLNHLGHNDFSDSSRPEFNSATGEFQVTQEHQGLSALGIAAIERINALGAVVDISQLSKAAALQVMRLSTSPVIASHSNAKSISDVTRNLSDEEIDLMGETGGVIHVAAFKGYLLNISEPEFIVELKRLRREAGISEEYNYPYELYWEIEDPADAAAYIAAASDLMGPATVDHMLDHIDYIVNRIGIDHVGIGNDFNHGSGIEGYDDASESENITIGLLNRGYSKSEIAKIWSGNFLRVLDAAATQGVVN
ncbi:MAG: dipeptidase [SAR86 cluster bacterium]|uniref:Dipeptidase n=1 Tax=SAR86 cluster bacterium TaxID=2030880 RepID=A0A2A4MUF3_9GAMM|nr:MAG: dipeptidase [SAR86 cluster bacterium]